MTSAPCAKPSRMLSETGRRPLQRVPMKLKGERQASRQRYLSGENWKSSTAATPVTTATTIVPTIASRSAVPSTYLICEIPAFRPPSKRIIASDRCAVERATTCPIVASCITG